VNIRGLRSNLGTSSGSLLYTSNSVMWLGEKVHPFMTKEHIAIPFKLGSYGEGQDWLIRAKNHGLLRHEYLKRSSHVLFPK